ncbi:MAG: flippase [Candidatus Omnitrophica bacterium]|nr:flippase [Candidatus Omnitrophota bacterium]MBU1808123.1 flippase [Candidatus Omnitrophota bacterium]
MEKIERNFIWLTAANVTSGLFTVILFIYLARTLEAENFGYLSYAGAIVFYIFNFIDLGLSTYGIREIAKDRPEASEYVSNIVSFKLILAVSLFTGFVIICSLSHQLLLVKILMLETALMFFVSALASEWAFQGLEKMYMVFVSLGLTSFLQLLLSVLIVKNPGDLLKVPLINFFASIPVIVFFLSRLKFRLRLFTLDIKKIRVYLSSSIVIWSISIFAQVYNGLDIAILGFFRPPQEVGYFSVARRIVGGVTLLMTFLASAVLPHLSSTFKDDMPGFRRGTRKFLKMSGMILVLIFVPVILFSSQIISLTVGNEYLPASMPLKIMMIAIVLVTFNLPYSTGLIAARLEKEVLKQACASAALSLFLNFLLIPRYGMIGASVSFFFAELLALIWIITVYNNKIRAR